MTSSKASLKILLALRGPNQGLLVAPPVPPVSHTGLCSLLSRRSVEVSTTSCRIIDFTLLSFSKNF